MTPGTTATFDYSVQPYENLCRPSPSCVTGATCPDCNYNSTGHTVPIYVLQSQAILYAAREDVVSVGFGNATGSAGLRVAQNSPNPFAPATSFEYSVPRPSRVRLLVHDVRGRLVQDLVRHHAAAGTFRHTWNGRDLRDRPVPAGVYFYTVQADGEARTRKMIRLR